MEPVFRVAGKQEGLVAGAFSNSALDRIWIMEFLPNEVEISHAIVGFEDSGKPILAGPWPSHDKWALVYFTGAGPQDTQSSSAGRYVGSDGFTASNLTEMRLHFGTDFASSRPANPVVKSLSAADTPADKLRRSIGGPGRTEQDAANYAVKKRTEELNRTTTVPFVPAKTPTRKDYTDGLIKERS